MWEYFITEARGKPKGSEEGQETHQYKDVETQGRQTQGRLPQKVPLWHVYYFKLKQLEKQQRMEGCSEPPLSPSPWNQEINLPWESYPAAGT